MKLQLERLSMMKIGRGSQFEANAAFMQIH